MHIIHPYLFLFLFFFTIFSVPKERSDKLRAGFIGTISSSWQALSHCKASHATYSKQLESENQALRYQVRQLRELLLFEENSKQLERHALVLNEKAKDPYYARRLRHLTDVIEKQRQALSAQVIFREPSLWSSTLWINLGERDNRALNRKVVAKNSPVLHGNVVVGVIEHVEESRSRLRLITDSALHLSVRIVRGGEQNRALAEQVKALIEQLSFREDLALSSPLRSVLNSALSQVDLMSASLYLAKGILSGSNHSKWRSRMPRLKGVGFNCDFSDEEGQARHLRTGVFADGSGATSIVKIGDLLVTTGLDGIFPADLPVATVVEIFPLQEGGCAYEIEALSLISDFDALTELYVLPPV